MCRMPNGSNFSWTLIDDKGLVYKLWNCKTRGASVIVPIFPQHSWLRCYMPKRPLNWLNTVDTAAGKLHFVIRALRHDYQVLDYAIFIKKKEKNSWPKWKKSQFKLRGNFQSTADSALFGIDWFIDNVRFKDESYSGPSAATSHHLHSFVNYIFD